MAHAVLSASGSKRWLSCPPSARLEQRFPDKAGEAAREGTHAHALAEALLRRWLGELCDEDAEALLGSLRDNPLYTKEMGEHVEEYVDLCIEKINEAHGTALVEERLDFSRWVKHGFGTGDMVIIGNDVLEIVDLKYGKGVPVSAEGNTQMQLYALGAIEQYDCIYDFDHVRMSIFQPRNGGLSTQLMSIGDLLAWGEQITGARDSGGAARTTNNAMELTALVRALEYVGPSGDLLIRADSQYAINTMTKWAPSWRRKGWKKADGKPVANRELVERLLTLYEARIGRTEVEWVRGHTGDAANELADALAVARSREFL